jgi:hypothetical protein
MARRRGDALRRPGTSSRPGRFSVPFRIALACDGVPGRRCTARLDLRADPSGEAMLPAIRPIGVASEGTLEVGPRLAG